MTTLDIAPIPQPSSPVPALEQVDPRDAGYLIRPGRNGLIDTRVRPDCGMCPARSRDTECKIHGVVADRAWWRTPAHLREDGDVLSATPALTPREVTIDAILVRDEAVGRWTR